MKNIMYVSAIIIIVVTILFITDKALPGYTLSLDTQKLEKSLDGATIPFKDALDTIKSGN